MIEDYSSDMRSSEDSAFAANGDIYVTDSGLVTDFGDDPGLYVRSAADGILRGLLRNTPENEQVLGDIVDLLVKPSGHVNTPPTVLTFEGPADPAPFGVAVSATATFFDPDQGDVGALLKCW